MWDQGIIKSDAGEVIVRPGMTIDEFRGTTFGANADTSPMGPGYEQVRLAGVTIDGHECVGYVYFFHGRLHSIHMGMTTAECIKVFGTEPPAGEDSPELISYVDWVKRRTPEDAQDSTRATRTEQSGRGIRKYFRWGSIGAVFDDRAWCTLIFVKYIYGDERLLEISQMPLIRRVWWLLIYGVAGERLDSDVIVTTTNRPQWITLIVVILGISLVSVGLMVSGERDRRAQRPFESRQKENSRTSVATTPEGYQETMPGGDSKNANTTSIDPNR